MVQEYGAVIVDSRREKAEMRRRQFGPRQSFEVRHTEDLIRGESCGIGGRAFRCRPLPDAKARHPEQRRSQT